MNKKLGEIISKEEVEDFDKIMIKDLDQLVKKYRGKVPVQIFIALGIKDFMTYAIDCAQTVEEGFLFIDGVINAIKQEIIELESKGKG